MDDLDQLAEADALTRARRTSELLGSYQDWVNELSRMRREALEELIAEGQTRRDLARLLGLTVSRVGQLLTSGPQVERALLGTGPLIVAIGGKPEEGKDPGEGSPMVSHEASEAYELIARTARAYGLDVSRETVPSDNGHQLRLSRPDLIVIGSPRILPLMRQVLEADENLGFGEEGGRWHLLDQGRVLWSPRDTGEPRDLAYIGRLPRTDGRGTFLYLAGIHAQGTLGGATWLTENVKEIYDQVKNRRWSVLVECSFDEDSRQITSTSQLTEIYTD